MCCVYITVLWGKKEGDSCVAQQRADYSFTFFFFFLSYGTTVSFWSSGFKSLWDDGGPSTDMLDYIFIYRLNIFLSFPFPSFFFLYPFHVYVHHSADETGRGGYYLGSNEDFSFFSSYTHKNIRGHQEDMPPVLFPFWFSIGFFCLVGSRSCSILNWWMDGWIDIFTGQYSIYIIPPLLEIVARLAALFFGFSSATAQQHRAFGRISENVFLLHGSIRYNIKDERYHPIKRNCICI